jgi:hypothetical protein
VGTGLSRAEFEELSGALSKFEPFDLRRASEFYRLTNDSKERPDLFIRPQE